MTITIRTYRDDDIETGRRLWEQLTEWHREIYKNPSIGGSEPGLQFDAHLERVGADRIWFAETDGEIVGMAGLIPENKDGSPEVEPIIVVPEARGTGVGRILIEHVFTVARELGARDVAVSAVGRNAEAIRFYHDMGFDIISYVDLFHDLRPASEQPWREGETIAGRAFRV
jgi:GNAT superfamily N-acetyltransferase